MQERVVQAIRAGNYAPIACRSAGISASTHYRWLERGELEPSSRYAAYAAAVRLAEAESEVYAVATVRRAMLTDWRAALAFLEPRHPDRWRRRTTTELTGKDGGPIETKVTRLDLSGLSDEQLELLKQINRCRADPDRR